MGQAAAKDTVSGKINRSEFNVGFAEKSIGVQRHLEGLGKYENVWRADCVPLAEGIMIGPAGSRAAPDHGGAQ